MAREQKASEKAKKDEIKCEEKERKKQEAKNKREAKARMKDAATPSGYATRMMDQAKNLSCVDLMTFE